MVKSSEVKTGHLYKRGRLNRSFKSRFFLLLSSGELHYFKDKESTRPISLVSISNAYIIPSSADSRTFEIVTPSRTYDLMAETTEDRDDWVRRLSRLSELHTQQWWLAHVEQKTEAAAFEISLYTMDDVVLEFQNRIELDRASPSVRITSPNVVSGCSSPVPPNFSPCPSSGSLQNAFAPSNYDIDTSQSPVHRISFESEPSLSDETRSTDASCCSDNRNSSMKDAITTNSGHGNCNGSNSNSSRSSSRSPSLASLQIDSDMSSMSSPNTPHDDR
eukprot:ANDGO_05293.mRNA.1 RAC family serine/threonine-protein kinase homolog